MEILPPYFRGSSIGQIVGSNIFHLSLCILGGFLCFLPLVTNNNSYLEDSTLRRSLTSGFYFRDSSIASLALSVPLALDIIFDLGISLVRRMRITPIETADARASLSNVEKFLCLIGVIVVPITAFIPFDYQNLALIFVCCNKCQSFVVGSTVMTSFCRCNRSLWSILSTLAFLFLMIFAQVTSTYSLNQTAEEVHSSSNGRLVYASDLCTMFAVCILLLCSLYSLFALISRSYHDMKGKKMIRPNETATELHARSHVFFSICWLSVFICGITFLIAISKSYGSITEFNQSGLFLNNITYLLFELAITILTMRMVKSDVVKGLYALIDSKKSYVRYISHELRTPLNTAFLGLKLLTDDMEFSRNPKDMDRFDTLRDVNLSCKAAVDILNNLLCFDKLESGILELHKQETNIIPFVTDCIAMFNVQAKENDVKVVFINTGSDPPEASTCRCSFVSTDTSPSASERDVSKKPSSPPIELTESVFIDKFKMDQVVMNLISNALKFTPKGGSITVKVTHVPKLEDSIQDIKKKPGRRRSRTSTSMFSNSNSSIEISAMNDDIESGLNCSFTEGTFVLEVTDTGAGISFENQKRLFKDIVQFNPEILQAGGGSGLGLWITKGIVDLHNGKISMFSEGEGKGCTFTVQVPMLRRSRLVTLPRLKVDKRLSISSVERCLSFSSQNQDDTCPMETSTIPGLENLFPSMDNEDCSEFDRIPAPTVTVASYTPSYELLVVDDSRLNRKMLCKILRGAGYHCDEAEDGLLAVAKVKERMSHPDEDKRSYNAILMDFVMPNMDGPTATMTIRALNYSSPIFGVTGNALCSDVEYFISCGADKIFTKPLNVVAFQEEMKVLF